MLFIQFHPSFLLVVREQVQWIMQFFKPLYDIFDSVALGIVAQQISNICHMKLSSTLVTIWNTLSYTNLLGSILFIYTVM